MHPAGCDAARQGPRSLHLQLLPEDLVHELRQGLLDQVRGDGVEHLEQISLHFPGGLGPVVWVARQRTHDHLIERRAHVPVDGAGRRDFDAPDAVERIDLGNTFEQPASGQHLMQQHAKGEDVRPTVQVNALRLLGRHVPQLARDRADVRLLGAADGPDDPEVAHLDLAHVGDQDVRGIDVTVHDVQRFTVDGGAIVRIVEALRHLERNVDGEADGKQHPSTREVRQEEPDVLSVHAFHRDEVVVAHLPEVVHADNVRGLKNRKHLGFVHEHPGEAVVACGR